MPGLSTLPGRETEWAGESPRNRPASARRKYLTMSSPPPSTPPRSATSNSSLRSSLQKHSLAQGDFKNRTKTTKAQKDASLLNAVKADYRFIYRINDGIGTTNTMLQKVCEERGWKEFREMSLLKHGTTAYERAMRGATGWNLWWSYSMYQFSPYKYLRNWQFTNHNPKGFQFCNKLYLTMFMRKMEVIHGPPFDFYPQSFIFPEDYLRLLTEHTRRAAESFTEYNHNNLLRDKPTHCCSTPVPTTPKPASQTSTYTFFSSPYSCRPIRPRSVFSRISRSIASAQGPATHSTTVEIKYNPVWISKPIALSQGKGIFLTTDLNQIPTDKKAVVQEYITRPFLIGGYKWDVRIYVCVAAIDPLVIYIYHEGLCRFCTEKYDTKDLSGTYSHLTNASINKLSPAYEDDKELIGHGCKWSLRQLRQHFKDRNICDWLLWQKVMAMVVCTVVGDALRLGYSASNRNCFDLFGFDVLVDENLKPWLLECNYSPGLGGDCKTDEVVKVPMLHELFNLLGFPDKKSYSRDSLSLNTGETRPETAKTEDEDELVPYDKNDITKHYFDMLLTKLKYNKDEDQKMKKVKWTHNAAAKTESRLNDAKSIYSQNLVVQYLKNQSAANKLSKQVRDQLISAAAKKLRSKLSEIGAISSGAPTKKEKKPKKQSMEPASEEIKIIDENANIDGSLNKSTEASPASSELPLRPKTTTVASLANRIEQEFPPTNSDAFQKLKYYFDAGVDYPMDAKTGKFKGCPALISVKRDWFKPPKQEGGWIRVYPFDARTTKSPYKSSLSDIRQAVRSIECYIKVAEQLYQQYPNESDHFYRQKIKSLGRRDTEVWTPPSTNRCSPQPSSADNSEKSSILSPQPSSADNSEKSSILSPQPSSADNSEKSSILSPQPSSADNSEKSSILISDAESNPVEVNNSRCQTPDCWQTSEDLESGYLE